MNYSARFISRPLKHRLRLAIGAITHSATSAEAPTASPSLLFEVPGLVICGITGCIDQVVLERK